MKVKVWFCVINFEIYKILKNWCQSKKSIGISVWSWVERWSICSYINGKKISRKFQIPHSYEWVQKLFIGETYVIRFGENPNYIWRKSKFEGLQLDTQGSAGKSGKNSTKYVPIWAIIDWDMSQFQLEIPRTHSTGPHPLLAWLFYYFARLGAAH